MATIRSRMGGLGLEDPEHVHGAAFLSSSLTFAASTDDLPESFWRDTCEAWAHVRDKYQLPSTLLSSLESALSGGGADINSDWMRQSWWKATVERHAGKAWCATSRLKAEGAERSRSLQ